MLGVSTLSLAAKRRVFRVRVSAPRFPRTRSSLLHIFSRCFCGRVKDGFKEKDGGNAVKTAEESSIHYAAVKAGVMCKITNLFGPN